MNANSQPKTPAISAWIHSATIQLAGVGIGSAKLDAEIILGHTLRKSRTFLHAHGDELLTPRQLEITEARLQLRLDRTPIAYIIGHKEFYGRLFRVTPATLIPRPESETIIELLKELRSKSGTLFRTHSRLIDVGTGSGCLGISAKLELPWLDVTLSDVSRHALKVAKTNADYLEANVTLLQSNLLADYPFSPDIILANLPYVDRSWERSPETKYEPAQALFATEDGLHLIYKLISQTSHCMQIGGFILLEADPCQHATLIGFAKTHEFTLYETRGFVVVLQKN